MIKCPYNCDCTQVNQTTYDYDNDYNITMVEQVVIEHSTFTECQKEDCAMYIDGKCQRRGQQKKAGAIPYIDGLQNFLSNVGMQCSGNTLEFDSKIVGSIPAISATWEYSITGKTTASKTVR